MSMRHERIEKASRVYRVIQFDADHLVRAEYRPRNPRTGAAWQASRTIFAGSIHHKLWNEISGESVVNPGMPSRVGWSEGGRWRGCSIGYRTFEDAVAAVELDNNSRG